MSLLHHEPTRDAQPAVLRAPAPVPRPAEAHSWMSHLPSHLRLDALTIPGTHDSGAVQGGRWVACQTMTIAEQLAAGVRHLDVRVRLQGGAFRVHHGRWFQGTTLDDVLDDCRAFLAAHPTETVLLSLKQEFRAREVVEVARHWAEVRARNAGLLVDGRRTPQLGGARGRVVVVSRDPGFTGLEQASWQVHDLWRVHTRQAWRDEKWPAVTDHLRRARAARGDQRMWSCHATSTGVRLPPAESAALVEHHLSEHFDELGPRPSGAAPERNGVVLLDFCSPALVSTLFHRNL